MKITAAQCRAARGLLSWSQRELFEHCGVSQKTIADFERGASAPYPRTMKDIVEAFQRAGVVFLEASSGEHQDGVALREGVEPLGDKLRQKDASSSTPGGALSSAPWDDFSQPEPDERPLSPEVAQIAASLTDEDRAELAEQLDTVPISPASRRMIERAMREHR